MRVFFLEVSESVVASQFLSVLVDHRYELVLDFEHAVDKLSVVVDLVVEKVC
jgi:hypothetical protein